jgi:serine/threonine protein kinase
MDLRVIMREIVSRYRSPRYRGKDGPFERFQGRDLTRELDVAISVLPRLLTLTPEQRQQLENLSRTILHLEHPRIVRALQVAQQEGMPYLVSALVKNAKTLAGQLSDKPMSLEQAGALIARVGSAIEYAGQQQLAHGALTPDQILIGEDGEPMVTGFGLSVLATLAGAGYADVNNPYLAPETRLADQPPTSRSDVYSLAAILYRLITGRPPDADPARIARPDMINPAIPPAVADVAMQALAADAQQRYQSADDFVLALRSAIRSPHIHGQGPAAQAVAPAPQPAEQAAAPAGQAAIPEPLPFPEPLPMPRIDLSAIVDATRLADAMLEAASQAVQMPEPLPMPTADVAAASEAGSPAPPSQRS